MKLSDIMTREVVTVDIYDTLRDIRDIFERSRFHHLVVMEEEKVVGIISDRDLLEHLSPFLGDRVMERPQDRNVFMRRAHEIMSNRPVVADEEMTVGQAARLLLEKQVGCLPVVTADRRVCGIVTWRDLLRHCCVTESAEAA